MQIHQLLGLYPISSWSADDIKMKTCKMASPLPIVFFILMVVQLQTIYVEAFCRIVKSREKVVKISIHFLNREEVSINRLPRTEKLHHLYAVLGNCIWTRDIYWICYSFFKEDLPYLETAKRPCTFWNFDRNNSVATDSYSSFHEGFQRAKEGAIINLVKDQQRYHAYKPHQCSF